MKKKASTGPKAASARPVLTIASKNYSSWSLRGWLLCKLAGLDVEEKVVSIDDPTNRAELLLIAPSVLVPRLDHDGVSIWDTLAIAEYLAELHPKSGMLPEERVARAHCRSIAGEMHSGFYNLRSALPMNLKAQYKGFKIFAGAQADIDRIEAIWEECLDRWGGPCHVRTGLHPFPDLFGADEEDVGGLLPHHHGLAADGRLGQGGQERAGRAGRARHGILGIRHSGAAHNPGIATTCVKNGQPLLNSRPFYVRRLLR